MSTSHRRSNRPGPLTDSPQVWASESAPRVSVAWITRPRSGEVESGDAVIVRQAGSLVLVGVVDALGHGPKAATVAESSAEYLSAASHTTVPALIHGLHGALQGSRGAAALLLLLSPDGGLEVCSVGNVELRSTDAKLPFVLTPGVLGVRLRQPKVCSTETSADRFVLFSDGISGRFDLRGLRALSPPDLATHIFATHRHAHDDATVVVVDVL